MHNLRCLSSSFRHYADKGAVPLAPFNDKVIRGAIAGRSIAEYPAELQEICREAAAFDVEIWLPNSDGWGVGDHCLESPVHAWQSINAGSVDLYHKVGLWNGLPHGQHLLELDSTRLVVWSWAIALPSCPLVTS